MWPFNRKEPARKNYALSKLVKRERKIQNRKIKPLLSKRKSYIKHTLSLRAAIISSNIGDIRFYSQYLKNNGLSSPDSLAGCDELLAELELWGLNGRR